MSLETFDPSHAPVRQVHSRIKNKAMNQGRIDELFRVWSISCLTWIYCTLLYLDILYAIRFYGIIVQVYRMGFTFDKIDPK